MIHSQKIQHSKAAMIRLSQVQFLRLETPSVLIGLKNHRGIILPVVEIEKPSLKRDTSCVGECRMNGSIKRGCAAGESDIQHRADLHGAAFLFSVVEAEPAIAVRFAEWIRTVEPTAAPLISTGRSLHDGLHTVEGWRAGEVHSDRSFFVK